MATTVEQLYTQILGRAPDPEGLAYWQSAFGGSVDPAEQASFMQAAQAELARRTPAEQAALAPKLFSEATATGVPVTTVAASVPPPPAAAPATEVFKREGKTYILQSDIVSKLTQQILSQGTADKWTGEGFGSAQANAADMAKIIATTGVTDINEFGAITKEVPVTISDEWGTLYDTGRTQTVTTYGNKVTGQEVPSTYGERQKDNAFGGTFTGSGNTGYRVETAADGTPIFYTTGASSSDVPSWVKPALIIGGALYGLNAAGLLGGTAATGAAGLTAAEAAGLGLTAAEAASLGLSAAEFAAAAGTAGTVGGTVAGISAGTGIKGTAAGLGINAAGTAGLGAAGTGAGITAGAGLTGTGILSGSTLGTGLLGTGAGLAGLTGTGILSGSTLGTNLLGTTGTGALTGTGVLTGSNLGTQLLGTGAGTAATVGGVTGLTNTANVGLGALGTGVTTGLTGLGAGALNTGVNVTGAGTGVGAGTVTGAGTGTVTGTGTGTGIGTGTLTNIGTGLSNLFSGGLGTAGNLLQMQQSREAALQAQARIDAETAAAKQAAAFRPVGMTTRFGTSQFQTDPVTGQLTSAGYTLSPEAKAQQDRFMALSNAGLTQAEAAQQQFAPLQTGAQNLFNLGNQYIAQSPESVAQNYLNQQMALLQPGRELELANLQNRLQQQGRGGLAVAQGGTMGATTPELQALYNARAQQEAVLAAQAQQAGQQQVAFGAGLLGQGAQTMGQYYGGQQAAYAPYTTAMGQVQGLEALGQQPFTLGSQLGQTASTAGARAGQLGLEGARLSTALATSADATRNLAAQSLIAAGNPNAQFGSALGGLFGGGLQSAFSGTGLGSSGFGTGLAYGNQDLGLYL